MAAQSVNLRFVVHIPSPNPVISRARTSVCDVLLENSPVIGIHQKSAKYRELLLLYSLTFAGMRVSVGANIYGDGYAQGNYTVSENVYFHDNLLYIENQYNSESFCEFTFSPFLAVLCTITYIIRFK